MGVRVPFPWHEITVVVDGEGEGPGLHDVPDGGFGPGPNRGHFRLRSPLREVRPAVIPQKPAYRFWDSAIFASDWLKYAISKGENDGL